jgi:hypothetical protein
MGTKEAWEWISYMEVVFKSLKQKFTTALLLIDFEPNYQNRLDINACELVIGTILSQKDCGRMYRHWHMFLEYLY